MNTIKKKLLISTSTEKEEEILQINVQGVVYFTQVHPTSLQWILLK